MSLYVLVSINLDIHEKARLSCAVKPCMGCLDAPSACSSARGSESAGLFGPGWDVFPLIGRGLGSRPG